MMSSSALSIQAAAEREARSRQLRLTDAWTPLKPHPTQQLFFWHPAAIKVCPAGRRSGKTALGKRKAVLQLVRWRKWPAKILIGAPTHDQVRTIYWEEINALIPPWWVAKVNETRLEITTRWGAVLRLMGLEKPQRAEGTPWDWMLLDEIADCKPGLLDRHLFPALGTVGRTVSCDMIGVPDEVGPNQAEYEKYWEIGLRWRPGMPPRAEAWDPQICSFHWPSADIIEPEKIARYRATMDPIEFEQEFGGRFVTSGGKALPRFSVQQHVSDYFTAYCPALALDWTLDFGVGSNAVALLCQSYKGHVWVMDEIFCDDGSTDVQVTAFRERCAQRGYSLRRVRLFGDAAGHSRHSNIGATDYEIIEGLTRDLQLERHELRAAPLIKDTVNAVRGRLCTADGVVHLHIHPRCKKLIECCKYAPWPAKLEEYHALAALRYYCFALFGETVPRVSTGTVHLPNLGGGPRARRPLRTP